MTIENQIKKFETGETIKANIGNLLNWLVHFFLLFSGISIVSRIEDPITQLFGLIVILLMFFKYIRFNFSVVYTAKKGGYIRYD